MRPGQAGCCHGGCQQSEKSAASESLFCFCHGERGPSLRFHRAPQFLQRHSDPGIALQLSIATKRFGYPLVVIGENRWERTQQVGSQRRSLRFRKLHHLLLKIAQSLHTGNLHWWRGGATALTERTDRAPRHSSASSREPLLRWPWPCAGFHQGCLLCSSVLRAYRL